MSAFRFPLQKVLDWRRTQLGLEEVRFRKAAAELTELDRARATLEADGICAELELRRRRAVEGSDLAALGEFRLFVRRKENEIAARRVEHQRTLEIRQAEMLEARRRCRLLERLKERRLAEWTLARDREIEEVASESFLARWQRTRPYNEGHDS